jgi:hypothetical protein
MAKSEVYSWRVSPETKRALEIEARREGESLGNLLERITREWVETRRESRMGDAQEQTRLHAAASKCFGAIAGSDPARSRKVRSEVRRRLRERHGR